jgi:hypothetical protein
MMTAEIVIMNKEAVAMAADSAVTMYGGKIFNSANKLYSLAPNHSVGILVYNNAHFMNVPWEIVIKSYRRELVDSGRRFRTLGDYAADFLRFMRESDGVIFTQSQQDFHFRHLLELVIQQDIMKRFSVESAKSALNRGKRIDERTASRLINDIVAELFDNWNSDEDLIEDERERNELVRAMTDRYRSMFEAIYDARLGQTSITQENKERFWQVCIYWFLKERWFHHFFSGLVFAGYGDDDLFPSVEAYQLESMICGHLKLIKTGGVSIDWNPGSMAINPFAQQDIIASLLFGKHPSYEQILRRQMAQVLAPDFPSAKVRDQKIDEILTRAHREATEVITNPIMLIVAALPKDELAAMAESLVSVTAFMRRVSNIQETVGGPIDVAVISKKDGFIWIKRKHYFRPELNYHFFNSPSNGGEK